MVRVAVGLLPVAPAWPASSFPAICPFSLLCRSWDRLGGLLRHQDASEGGCEPAGSEQQLGAGGVGGARPRVRFSPLQPVSLVDASGLLDQVGSPSALSARMQAATAVPLAHRGGAVSGWDRDAAGFHALAGAGLGTASRCRRCLRCVGALAHNPQCRPPSSLPVQPGFWHLRTACPNERPPCAPAP